MPASSKSQQRFFGVVKAMQKGDIPKKGRAGKIAKSMSKDDVDDFASTKHKGKPEKVKREQRVRELIKKMVREELDERMKTGPLTPKQSKEAGSMKNYLKKNNPFSEEDLEETTVRISTMKDVSFAGRDRLQLVGKKGKIGLDRKSVSALAKAVRMALGRSFITHEEKLNEAKTITLPNGVKAKIEFKGITLQKSGKKPVFLDRTEMMKFFQATQKYMKQGLTAGKMSEAKIKPKQKISKKEWSKIKKFNKHIGQDGTHYVVQLNKKLGTILVPVIVEGKLNEEKPYETILKQLGGNRFVAMTGAKNLGTNGKDLSFSIGRNAKKVTHVHIKLTSMDLYDVEFINMRGAKRKVIKKVKGVYGDMLPKIFKKYTGMNVRL
jgi:hypothetical protein